MEKESSGGLGESVELPDGQGDELPCVTEEDHSGWRGQVLSRSLTRTSIQTDQAPHQFSWPQQKLHA